VILLCLAAAGSSPAQKIVDFLHFDGTDGGNAASPLVESFKGSFYGARCGGNKAAAATGDASFPATGIGRGLLLARQSVPKFTPTAATGSADSTPCGGAATVIQHGYTTGCVGNGSNTTCTITPSSASGANHLGAIIAWFSQSSSASSTGITQVSGNNNGTTGWTACPGHSCFATVGTPATGCLAGYCSQDIYYNPSLTGGDTSFTVTLGSPPPTYFEVWYGEWALPGTGGAHYDTSGSGADSTACTSCTGQALTLLDKQDIVLQTQNSSQECTAISGPYTNPVDVVPVNLYGGIAAAAIDQTSAVTPTYTCTLGTIPVSALALAECSAALATQTPTDVYNFKGGTGDVANPSPYGTMVQGFDGTQVSAAPNDGANGDGGVFAVTTSGTETLLHSFQTSDGTQCQPGLNRGTDGNFYGTCYFGGTGNDGTIYKVTPTGTFTVLHSFTGGADGAYPNGPPIQATDGNFYGTNGTNNANGTVYKITAGGTLTTLYSFTAGADGYGPSASLVEGTDGNLYGSTQFGGSGGDGTIFKITRKGKLTTLHSFSGADGSRPIAALVQGTDGNFYGTTYQGGVNNLGALFKISSTGKFSLLHSFAGATDGQNPDQAMLQATDGNFYGVALFGGNAGGWMGSGQGTIYKLSLTGAFSTLYLFDGTVGSNPSSALVQNTDGLLYGDTYTASGTGQADGILYSWSIGANPFLSLQSTSGKVGSTLAMLGQGFDSSSVVKFNGVAATKIVLTGTTYIAATVPAGASTGFVTVTTGATTLTSTQRYLVHNSWSNGAAIPVAVRFPATGVINGKIYVVGGDTVGGTTGAVTDHQIYNTATNAWTTGAALPVTTYAAASAVVKNILYVFGGTTTGTNITNAVWSYNPSTNKWTSETAMPTARQSAASAVENNIIYVIGGNDTANGRFATVEAYNPATNAWTEEAPMLVGKSEPSVGLLGTTIVSADGYNGSADTGDNEGYTVSTNSWKSFTADPTGRNAACAGVVGGDLYVAGGYPGGGAGTPAMTLNESFYVTSDKWTTLAPMPQATVTAGSAVNSGLLYCIGGESANQGTVLNNVQIYQP